jgi:hypothetical protein
MQGVPLGPWQKCPWALQISERRDFHTDDHAAARDAKWQQELTLLLREP